ncbi:MAG: FKBP-type peptidyl-prolyl cis-trans isomerase [Desulfuromonadia bacterium]
MVAFKRFMTVLFVASIAGTSATAATGGQDVGADHEKTLYSIGVNISDSLKVFDLTDSEFQQVLKGFVESRKGASPGFDPKSYDQAIQKLARERRARQGERLAAKGQEFLQQKKKEQGAITTPSGLVYIPKKEGTGDPPKTADSVKVHYRGTLVDGREFDSSHRRGAPATFRLDGVIPCWREGLTLMRPGGRGELVCPPELAYGDRGAGDMILPKATLSFDVELLEIVK